MNKEDNIQNDNSTSVETVKAKVPAGIVKALDCYVEGGRQASGAAAIDILTS